MSWTKNLSRTPTWPEIVLQLALGLVFLSLAVLDGTRFADQVASHGDQLMTVAMAAVGGPLIGSAIGLVRQRAAMRQAARTSSAAAT